jgi:8-oxo-dGTP pyrophosphatase MutT (NUDIX family)
MLRLRKLREKSAGGVVMHQRKVLVLRHESGEWVMPKGKIEEHESDSAAAIREVKEETGVTALVGMSLGTTQYEYPLNGSTVHKTVHWFLMNSIDENLRIEPVFDEAKFVTPEEALELLTHDNDRTILKKAIAMLAPA